MNKKVDQSKRILELESKVKKLKEIIETFTRLMYHQGEVIKLLTQVSDNDDEGPC